MSTIRPFSGACGAALFFCFALVIGCSSSVRPKAAPNQALSGEPESRMAAPQTTLRYESDIRPLIESRCGRCHYPGGYMYAAVPLNSYAKLRKRAAATRLRVFVNKSMPFQQPMPDEERKTIAEWIDAGLPRTSAAQ